MLKRPSRRAFLLGCGATLAAAAGTFLYTWRWEPHWLEIVSHPLPISRLPTIALNHTPDTVDLPVWAGFDGWILSGDTHGGQCKPPFLPPPMLPVRNTRYTSGEFDLSGRRRLYINRGVGHWYRVRFNARPEITLHELQPEQDFA